MVVGILALQGCVEPHEQMLRGLGVPSLRVKSAAELDAVAGLILPGGESSTMLKLAEVFSLVEPLKQRARLIPYWGICAGAILLARELEGKSRAPGQYGLGIMDLVVARNAYGRQLESFSDYIDLPEGERQISTFIRAPKFCAWGKGVSVEGKCRGEVVFLREGRHMVTAFHPELSTNPYFHQRFLAQLS